MWAKPAGHRRPGASPGWECVGYAGWSPAPGRKPGLGTLPFPPPLHPLLPTPRTRIPPQTEVVTCGFPPPQQAPRVRTAVTQQSRAERVARKPATHQPVSTGSPGQVQASRVRVGIGTYNRLRAGLPGNVGLQPSSYTPCAIPLFHSRPAPPDGYGPRNGATR